MSCSLVNGYDHFGETAAFIHRAQSYSSALKMKVAGFTEIFVPLQEPTCLCQNNGGSSFLLSNVTHLPNHVV
jgi:hypothetical protein